MQVTFDKSVLESVAALKERLSAQVVRVDFDAKWVPKPHQQEPLFVCECGFGCDKPGLCPVCSLELTVGTWRVWLQQAGRGAGKSRSGAENVVKYATLFPGIRQAAVGINARHVRAVMIEGESGILACAPVGTVDKDSWSPSTNTLRFRNGSIVETFYSEAAYLLRGPQFHRAWADEISSWADAPQGDERDTTWNNLMMATRLHREGCPTRIIATSTPRPVKLVKDIRAYPFVHISYGSTFANADNLDEMTLTVLKHQYAGTRLERQEIYGELLEDNPLALWQRDWIDRSRFREQWENPERWYDEFCEKVSLVKCVVAVDPAVSTGDEACDHGIVVVGLGRDGHGYVLADGTCRGGPEVWAAKAVALYERFRADAIVAERNQGGDLVVSAIRAQSSTVPIRTVVATRGKVVRAEPIAMLYEQGRFHHVGTFPIMEDEMVAWDAELAKKQKWDRIDALVWGATDIMPNIVFGGGFAVHSRMPRKRYA